MTVRGINKVIIVGNLGQDPEVRYMPNGGAVASLSLATSESWRDKQTGEMLGGRRDGGQPQNTVSQQPAQPQSPAAPAQPAGSPEKSPKAKGGRKPRQTTAPSQQSPQPLPDDYPPMDDDAPF